MRALAFGGGRVRMSWLKAVAVAAAVRKVRRVTSNTIVLGKEHKEHAEHREPREPREPRLLSCSFPPIIHVRKPLLLQPPILHTHNLNPHLYYPPAHTRV